MVGALGLFSLAGSIGKYGVSQSLAKEQADRARKLRTDASNVKSRPLQQEYRDIEKMKALQVLAGMPGYSENNAEIEQAGATGLRTGQEGAGSSSEYLQYASNLYESQNQAKRDLRAQRTAYQAGAMNDYTATLAGIGQEKKENDLEAQGRKDAILAQSAELENASTANKYQGKSDAIGNISSDLASMAGGIAGGAGGLMGGGQKGATTQSGGLQFSKPMTANKTGIGTVTMIGADGKIIEVQNDFSLIGAYLKRGYKMV